MNGIKENIEEYNLHKKQKHWSHLMIWLLASLVIKKLDLTVPGLFIRGRKLNSSLAFITQSYFVVSKNIRLNLTNYFVIKVPNKRELQLIVFEHSSDIDF